MLDLITKVYFAALLATESIRLLPFLSLSYVCNPGAAFGMLAGHRWLLTAFGCLLVGFFIWEINRESKREGRSLMLLLAYSLVLAGATGNLLDRVLNGCVTDFIFLHYWGYGFPVFNLADVCITFGANLWIWTLIHSSRSDKAVSNGSN